MPSSRNITRQPESPKRPSPTEMIRALTVDPTAVEIGTATMNQPTARARYSAGNQKVRYRMMPGKKPASATPSRKRRTISTVAFGANAMIEATMPQDTRIRVIHRRAPKRCSARLLGTSSSR